MSAQVMRNLHGWLSFMFIAVKPNQHIEEDSLSFYDTICELNAYSPRDHTWRKAAFARSKK